MHKPWRGFFKNLIKQSFTVYAENSTKGMKLQKNFILMKTSIDVNLIINNTGYSRLSVSENPLNEAQSSCPSLTEPKASSI